MLLWAIKGRLSSRILESIYDDSNVALVSAAALWEVAIKLGLGKIDAPPDLPRRNGRGHGPAEAAR